MSNMFYPDDDALPDGLKPENLPYDPVPDFNQEVDVSKQEIADLRALQQAQYHYNGEAMAYRYIGNDPERLEQEKRNALYAMVRVTGAKGHTLRVVHQLLPSAKDLTALGHNVKDYKKMGKVSNIYHDVLGFVSEDNMIVYPDLKYLTEVEAINKSHTWLGHGHIPDIEKRRMRDFEETQDMLIEEKKLYQGFQQQQKINSQKKPDMN